MKALHVLGFDGFHQWALEEVPSPLPGPHEVQVRIAANAISYVDLLVARGGYQIKPQLPMIPGSEFSGVVTACGPQVERIHVGQTVTGTAFGGAWAQVTCALASAVEPLPDGADLRAASGLATTYATALYALKDRGQLQPGETVLVLGAAGGVGLASVQVGKALGARVLAGASTAAKMEAARLAGADGAFDTSKSDWRATVQAAAPGGVDVVLDPVGGTLTDTAFRMLRWGGRHLVVGFAEGSIPALRSNLSLLKGAALVGVDLRQFREREPERAQANLAEVVALFARGALQPRVAQVHPVENWPLALSAAADRGVLGRVILDWTTLESQAGR